MIDHATFQDTLMRLTERMDGSASRFCIVVWREDDSGPTFLGGNDHSAPRVLKMLAMAGTFVENMGGIESGSA